MSQPTHSRTYRIAHIPIFLLIVFLLGAWVRIDALTYDVRFHSDEALFATFARNAAVYGDWMLSGALDKTPLSLYTSALSMQFTGVTVNGANVLDLAPKIGEFSARLPSVFAGLVLIALVYRLTWALSQSRQASLTAALLIGLSPFVVAYNATAFTDSLMLALMVGALAMALEGHVIWAGVLLALSIAAKQQGVYYLPLVILLASVGTGLKPVPTSDLAKPVQIPDLAQSVTTRFLRFILAFILALVPLILWDVARPETSIFTLASANNAPSSFLASGDALLPRLRFWLEMLGASFGAWWMSVFVLGAGVVSSIKTVLRPVRVAYMPPLPLRAFLLYTLAYLLLHWLIPFNLYDRYLLPLVPLLAVMAGIGFARMIARLNQRVFYGMLAGIALILLILQAPFPQDNRRRDNSIIQLADWLNAQPVATIIYDHWLGWELGYYMGAWSDKRRVYYPSPEVMATDTVSNPETAPRYIVFPDYPPDSPLWSASVPDTPAPEVWLGAMRESGFDVSDVPVFEIGGFTVYAIRPPD